MMSWWRRWRCSCLWKGSPCEAGSIHQRFTDMGLCYTFNGSDMFVENSGTYALACSLSSSSAVAEAASSPPFSFNWLIGHILLLLLLLLLLVLLRLIIILSGSYVFQPIALETLGPINESVVQFLNDLGHKIIYISADDNEAQFHFQRLSVAPQRFNAILLLHESFGCDVDPDL